MVFTDLVSSTALKSGLPGIDITERNEKYLNDILTPHRQRIERDLEASGGRVVKTEGDAYFLVFNDVAWAARWAITVQKSHKEHPIVTPLGPLQVKMGMHFGSPLIDPKEPSDYVGHEVDYAARVAALAKGGQIVLSEVAAALIRNASIMDIHLHSLGETELKGIGIVPIFELLVNNQSPVPLKSKSSDSSSPPKASGSNNSQKRRKRVAVGCTLVLSFLLVLAVALGLSVRKNILVQNNRKLDIAEKARRSLDKAHNTSKKLGKDGKGLMHHLKEIDKYEIYK